MMVRLDGDPGFAARLILVPEEHLRDADSLHGRVAEGGEHVHGQAGEDGEADQRVVVAELARAAHLVEPLGQAAAPATSCGSQGDTQVVEWHSIVVARVFPISILDVVPRELVEDGRAQGVGVVLPSAGGVYLAPLI